jgi:hypothetical protein
MGKIGNGRICVKVSQNVGVTCHKLSLDKLICAGIIAKKAAINWTLVTKRQPPTALAHDSAGNLYIVEKAAGEPWLGSESENENAATQNQLLRTGGALHGELEACYD